MFFFFFFFFFFLFLFFFFFLLLFFFLSSCSSFLLLLLIHVLHLHLPLLLPLLHPILLLLLLLLWHYNSDRLLALSTVSFYLTLNPLTWYIWWAPNHAGKWKMGFNLAFIMLRQSRTSSAQFIIFIFFRSFLTSTSHSHLDLANCLPLNGFHLFILLTVSVSGFLFLCPNRLNRRALT